MTQHAVATEADDIDVAAYAGRAALRIEKELFRLGQYRDGDIGPGWKIIYRIHYGLKGAKPSSPSRVRPAANR